MKERVKVGENIKYMHFDTQHVEIGPKMAEIAKIV